MREARIIAAALEELTRLSPEKPWMTARGLARRIRSRHPELRPLSQVEVHEALTGEAEKAERGEKREIRNSRSPSARTLEVLWGAIRLVEEDDVEPPRKRDLQNPPTPDSLLTRTMVAQQESRASLGREMIDSAPDYFLSYNFDDSDAAARVTALLEEKGHSLWMAGTCIACGELINDTVREAMTSARELLLFLSASSLRSLWVAKEQLVGVGREMPRTIVVNGNDDDLMGLVRHWMAGGEDGERVGEFGGLRRIDSLSYNVAASFREALREEIANPESRLFVFPSRGIAPGERLEPLEAFPDVAEAV